MEQEHEKEWEYDEGIQKNKMSSEITGRYDADRNVSGCTDPFHDCWASAFCVVFLYASFTTATPPPIAVAVMERISTAANISVSVIPACDH